MQRNPETKGQRGKLLATATLLGLSLSASHAAVLVNLDATAQPVGPLPTWANTGATPGNFNSVATVPQVITVDGVKGVAIQSDPSGAVGTSYVGPTAPAAVCGDGSRTIEAWIWDPAGQDEKTVVSWSRRGGPDYTFCSFGHGLNGTWGGLAGWGSSADIGWTTLTFSRWTYIVYTYDPATKTARLFKDGVQDKVEGPYGAPFNTWSVDNNAVPNPLPFRIARQNEANGTIANSGIGTNVIAKVRVHDVVLDASAIQAQYDAEKTQFGLVDTDNDGLPNWWELRYGLNPDVADGSADLDNDGSSNLQEFQRGTLVNNPDTDGDGVPDGAETGTGIWVSTSNRGTDPLKVDSDGDGIRDGAESNTGTYVSSTDTGTNPNKKDTDGDTWNDGDEILLGSNPNNATSKPSAGSWASSVTMSAPKYWYRFEELDPTLQATNSGSATAFQGAYGPGINATNLGRPSALPSLGNAIEFTGPAANNATTKYVDMAATVPGGVSPNNIPELVNFRPPTVDKTTTVEYWFKTTQRGTHGGNSWQSPAIIARESPGDGDMYWGKINDQGEFGFSTSDINDILTRRDMGKDCTDGNWHHLVMVKEWHVNQTCVSTMYLDGGPNQPGGASVTKTTAAGNASYQDTDSVIRYIGFTQNGELENVQYIGMLDEVVIYDRALSEGEVRLHAQAVANADTDGDGMPDVYELAQGFNPNSAADAAQDADSDGSTNLAEYQRHTNPHLADTDGDGLLDGVETGTGVWVSSSNTGTDPLNADTDRDGLSDSVENNTGVYASPTATGTSPLRRDSDGDGYSDRDEIVLGTDPAVAGSSPAVPASWSDAVNANNPLHWLTFEETSVASGIVDFGSAGLDYTPVYGAGILDTDLGKDSAHLGLGKAMEFTAPVASATTTKFVDFGKNIPELINPRQDSGGAAIPMVDGKATTVEYWYKSTIHGSNGNNGWQNPSILAHESGGDGDMFWGNFNQDGDFIFSTSDYQEARVSGSYATDGNWHHVVMSKIWYTNAPSITRLYIDGGVLSGGRTIETTTPAGNASGQDNDSGLRYLGFTQSGELNNVQFIGFLDEFLIYDTAFVEAQARQHFLAAGGVAKQIKISYAKSGTSLVLTWPQGVLQSLDQIGGTWTTVTNATSPYTNAISGSQKFFRTLVP